MKKCFVVMGFGEKTDLATGRTLDLDKTYRVIIKKAVEAAGLECIRADDVMHAGIIDTPMYELLLDADLVIADLSTSNANAIYELGVRHALRPHTTIVIAERQFRFPFDLGHLLIRPYEHLGKSIDAEEADKVRAQLVAAIEALVKEPKVDSPVYTFLPQLREWPAAGGNVAPLVPSGTPPAPAAAAALPADDGKATALLELFREARATGSWVEAAMYLTRLLERRPNDEYLRQQLALATYKGKKPDVMTALQSAKGMLQQLNPHGTTDPETLGLWGAVHKRLWEEARNPADLDEGILALEKGFYVKNDHYNGINLAFMLNVRAAVASSPNDAMADTVQATRIRRRVIAVCEQQLAAGLRNDAGEMDREQTFWVSAALIEALHGSGDSARADALKPAAYAIAPEGWMVESMNDQLGKLARLLTAAPARAGG